MAQFQNGSKPRSRVFLLRRQVWSTFKLFEYVSLVQIRRKISTKLAFSKYLQHVIQIVQIIAITMDQEKLTATQVETIHSFNSINSLILRYMDPFLVKYLG